MEKLAAKAPYPKFHLSEYCSQFDTACVIGEAGAMRLLPRTCKLLMLFGAFGMPESISAQNRFPDPREERVARAKPVERPEPKNVREQFEQILGVKNEIDEAKRANDPQRVLELGQRLQKLQLIEQGVPGFAMDFGGRPIERVTPRPKIDVRVQYEMQLKAFEELIEKLKDNPDARKQLEKACDEYKKAMEKGTQGSRCSNSPARPQAEF